MREGERRVVAPGEVALVLGERHELDHVDAQPGEVVELRGRAVEVPRPAPHAVVEGAEVHLINNLLVERRRLVVDVAPPVLLLVVDDALAVRLGDILRARVVLPEGVEAALDDELVAGTRVRPLHVDREVPVALAGELVAPLVPAVEVAGDEDPLGVRRPDPEGGAAPVGDRAHARPPRRLEPGVAAELDAVALGQILAAINRGVTAKEPEPQ
jgi:hypothetical protein